MVTALSFKLADKNEKTTGLKLGGTTEGLKLSSNVIPMVSKSRQGGNFSTMGLQSTQLTTVSNNAKLTPAVALLSQKEDKSTEKSDNEKDQSFRLDRYSDFLSAFSESPVGKTYQKTASGGYEEHEGDGSNRLVKITTYDKNGNVVMTQKVTYKTDEKGNLTSQVRTIYDANNKKCGSVEITQNSDIIVRDKNGKVVVKSIFDKNTFTHRFVDANGKSISAMEAHLLCKKYACPQDEKYNNYVKDEQAAAKEANSMNIRA